MLPVSLLSFELNFGYVDDIICECRAIPDCLCVSYKYQLK